MHPGAGEVKRPAPYDRCRCRQCPGLAKVTPAFRKRYAAIFQERADNLRESAAAYRELLELLGPERAWVAADEMEAGRAPPFRAVTPKLRRLYTGAQTKIRAFGRQYIELYDEMTAMVGAEHAMRVADDLEKDVRW